MSERTTELYRILALLAGGLLAGGGSLYVEGWGDQDRELRDAAIERVTQQLEAIDGKLDDLLESE